MDADLIPEGADAQAHNITDELAVEPGDVLQERVSRDEYEVGKIGLEVELQPVDGGRSRYFDARRFREGSMTERFKHADDCGLTHNGA